MRIFLYKQKKKNIKGKIISLFILIILLFNLFISIFPIQINALNLENINYNFDSEILYNNTEPYNDLESWNIRNQTINTYDYKAIYSFENEIGLTGTDINFVDSNNMYGCEIISSYAGHNAVLRLEANNNWRSIINNFDNSITSGYIDFWFNVNNNNVEKYIGKLYQNGIMFLELFLGRDSNIYYYKDVGGAHIFATYQANIWNHFRIHFDTITDNCSMWLNGLKVIDNKDCRRFTSTNYTYINKYYYGSYNDGTNGFVMYIDAIDYSWSDDYYENRNLIPYYQTNENSYEVDKYEFALQSENVLNPINSDNPNGWNDLEYSTYDYCNVIADTTNDRKIYIQFGGLSSYTPIGLTKDFDYNNDILNISWYMRYQIATSSLSGITNMDVYSNDTTLITRIRIYNIVVGGNYHALQYYDGANYHNLTIGILGYNDYTFNLYINYNDNLAHLIYNNGSNNHYTFPLIINGKVGLGKIQYYIDDFTNNYMTNIYLDWIGIYGSGKSLTKEFGYQTLDLENSWNLHTHNLIYTHITNYFNISVCSGSYNVENNINKLMNYSEYITYDKIYNTTINIYSLFQNIISNANLLLYETNFFYDVYLGLLDYRGFSLNNILIKGIILTDDKYNISKNMYSFNFLSNWYPFNNFFYENNNRMYFNLTCTDTSLEYINIKFNINNEYSRNFSIQMLNNYIYTFYTSINFTIIYNDLTQFEYIFNYTGYYDVSEILEQNKYIDKFSFNISDNDNNLASGSITSGYFNTITLRYLSNIPITIITLNLLQFILPFLIILPISAISRNLFKKEKEKELICLFFMILSSIICTIAELISWQILGLLIFGYIFIIINKKEKQINREVF